MMALANTYGLLFIILLLGHGLIQVPRQLWETSFNVRELQRLYFVATQVLSYTTERHCTGCWEQASTAPWYLIASS